MTGPVVDRLFSPPAALAPEPAPRSAPWPLVEFLLLLAVTGELAWLLLELPAELQSARPMYAGMNVELPWFTQSALAAATALQPFMGAYVAGVGAALGLAFFAGLAWVLRRTRFAAGGAGDAAQPALFRLRVTLIVTMLLLLVGIGLGKLVIRAPLMHGPVYVD